MLNEYHKPKIKYAANITHVLIQFEKKLCAVMLPGKWWRQYCNTSAVLPLDKYSKGVPGDLGKFVIQNHSQ